MARSVAIAGHLRSKWGTSVQHAGMRGMCRRGNSLFPRRRNGHSRSLNEGWVVFVFNTACQQAAGRILELLLHVDILRSAVLAVMGALGELCTCCRNFKSTICVKIWAYMYFLRRLDQRAPATRWRMLSSLLTRLSAREVKRPADGGV